MSRSRSASACLASEAVSAATRSWSACAFATAAARWDSARLMAMSRSASAAATSASRLIRAMSGRPMLVMYSFLSRTSFSVKLTTSSPILFMSAAHVERMRSPTISGSFTICSTVSWPMMPRRCPSMTSRIKPSRCSGRLVRNCSAAVRMDTGSDFTLSCATASTVTATPWLLYRLCCGATSNDISSSESSRHCSSIGMRIVPPLVTVLGPRIPYTMSASCGPTFRKSVANPAIAKRIASTSSPAITGTDRPNIKTSLFHSAPDCLRRSSVRGNFCRRLLREVFPFLDVGDSILVARDRHFRAVGKRVAVFAPRPDAFAHSLLLKNHFSRAALADRRADRADGPLDAVVPIQHVGVAHFHNLCHEFENHSGSKDSGRSRDEQCGNRDQPRMRGEDVANPAEPGEKDHDRHGVKPREAAPDMRHSPPGQPAGVVPPMKRQVPFEREMDMSCTAKERQHAEREAHDETEKIEISPGHWTPRAHPVRELEFETQTLQFSFAATRAAEGRCLLGSRCAVAQNSKLLQAGQPTPVCGESPPGAARPCVNPPPRQSPAARVVAPGLP